MSVPGLAQALADAAFEAREFDRLKKNGHFARNAARIAAAKAEPVRLPRVPREIVEGAATFAIVDRPEYVAEPNDAGAVSLQPLAEFDDAIARPEDDPRQLKINAVEAALLEIAKRDTGDCADPEERQASEQRKAELRSLSLEFAADLEAEGAATCLRQDEFVIWLQGAHSGIVDAPVRFNSIMLLPAVQAQRRHPYLQAAGFFLQSRPHARTAVFTTGPRTKLRDVRKRVCELNRELSRLNSEIRREFGVEIVLRSDELGTPEWSEDGDETIDPGAIERDEDGEPTFHVHAHVILSHIDGKPLPYARWCEFVSFVGKRWGYWWKELGELRDAAETVKYITKPREIQKLTRQEKAELYRQLRGLKLLQPMGALRSEMRSRDERGMRLDRHPTPDGRVWREVPCWNKHGPRQPPADAQEAALRHVCESPGDPFRVKDHERPERGETWPGEKRATDPDVSCTAILPPGFMPGSLVREPIFVMRGKRIDLEAWKTHRRCVLVANATRDEWAAGQAAAAAIMVHTCTPTVGTDLPGFEVSRVLESRPIPRPAAVSSV